MRTPPTPDNNLKPCPFCGCAAELSTKHTRAVVFCTGHEGGCGVSVEVWHDKDAETLAIERWNTRSPEKYAEGHVKGVEMLVMKESRGRYAVAVSPSEVWKVWRGINNRWYGTSKQHPGKAVDAPTFKVAKYDIDKQYFVGVVDGLTPKTGV